LPSIWCKARWKRCLQDSPAQNLETLTFLDPACGSGHILVKAYRHLREVYLSRGYSRREVPRLILENNLFGLDIDPRAVQLASLALMLEARKDDPQVFSAKITLNVHTLVSSAGLSADESDLSTLGACATVPLLGYNSEKNMSRYCGFGCLRSRVF